MSLKKNEAYEVILDENRSIKGKPVEGATLYRIVSGRAVTYISLTNEAVCAMFKIMQAIQAVKEAVQPKKVKKSKATP